MSTSLNALATELGTNTDVIAEHARDLLQSGGPKVLTVATDDTDDDVTCLTDEAADTIRTRFTPPPRD